MGCRAFFSCYYKPDCTRASQVRKIGALEGNTLYTVSKSVYAYIGGNRAARADEAVAIRGRCS